MQAAQRQITLPTPNGHFGGFSVSYHSPNGETCSERRETGRSACHWEAETRGSKAAECGSEEIPIEIQVHSSGLAELLFAAKHVCPTRHLRNQ